MLLFLVIIIQGHDIQGSLKDRLMWFTGLYFFLQWNNDTWKVLAHY